MKYIICKISDANSNGIPVTQGHPTSGGLVCLTSSDLALCPNLSGNLEEMAEIINGTIYNSAKEVNEVIKNWQV